MKTAQDKLDFYAARHAQQRQRAEDGQHPAAGFFASIYGHYVEESRDEIVLEERARSGEVLNVRFMGPRAESGRMPLRDLLDTVDPLERAMVHAAHKLRTGQVAAKKANEARSSLGLEFGGLEHGSTHVLILGDSREDTTGVNLFDVTAQRVFGLLLSEGEDFYAEVDAIGGQAVRHIGRMLEKTGQRDLTVAISWERPRQPLAWDGRSGEMDRVRRMIESVSEPERYEETLDGVVTELSASGTIMLDINGQRRKVRFPLKGVEQVRKLNPAMPARLRVSTARYFDVSLGRDVFEHTLIAAEP